MKFGYFCPRKNINFFIVCHDILVNEHVNMCGTEMYGFSCSYRLNGIGKSLHLNVRVAPLLRFILLIVTLSQLSRRQLHAKSMCNSNDS